MLQDLDNVLEQINFVYGSSKKLMDMLYLPAKEPFSDDIIDFLNDISRILMKDEEAKQYPDIITFAFWIRRANMIRLKGQYKESGENVISLGRGTIFHVAPSNVAVNYAYSLVAGLVTGNSNIVRIPSKKFPQISIINAAIKKATILNEEMSAYICMVQYGHIKSVNDLLSQMADTRVIWGGDLTIQEIRKSSMKPRATEIVFSDRYSFSIIDSDAYMDCKDWVVLANNFYNDTYLTDQNACTSPKLVIWTGTQKAKAKEIFWEKLNDLVGQKYHYQDIQGVNKLTSLYLLAAEYEGIKKEVQKDNLIVRITVPSLFMGLMDYTDNSGYFLEYNCDDIMELRDICGEGCQTISYYGDKEMLFPLIRSGVKGIDRVVPLGKTMDFDLIWDGYNLVDSMTRKKVIL